MQKSVTHKGGEKKKKNQGHASLLIKHFILNRPQIPSL